MNRLAVVFVSLVALVGLAMQAEASIFVTGNVPITGVQAWGGPLGDDFMVGGADLTVTSLGVFDAGQDGLDSDITAYIYALGGGAPLLTLNFPNGTAGNGTSYVWQTLGAPVTLLAGQSYTLVAEGYSQDEFNSNSNNGSTVTFSQDGYTLLQSRYGATPGLYPNVTPAAGENWHFGAANIQYNVVPEPATLIVWSLLGGLAVVVGWLRRKSA